MPIQSLKDLTVDEVLEAVKNGELTADEALRIEISEKNRKTLVEALKEPSDDDPQDKNDDEEFQSCTLIKNIKYGTSRFKIGDVIEIPLRDMDAFKKAEAIRND